jgi:hypothetical protein
MTLRVVGCHPGNAVLHDPELQSIPGLLTMTLTFAFLPNFGLTELVVVGLLSLLSLVLPIWGIIDAAQRPDWQWKAIGSNRTTWIVLMAVFLLLCAPVGLVISTYYLASLRPRLSSSSLQGDL